MKKTAKQSPAKVNRKLAREWHPTKNAPLTPKDVTAGSGRKVWWLCGKGHQWEAAISSRSMGRGCPYCSGFYACKDNCLQTLNPKLAKEWHPAKNALLTPRDVTAYSNKEVWWTCRKGHEWRCSVDKRSAGGGCPYCSGHRACKDNCLKTINPGLAAQWHPTRNAPLTPEKVTPGSRKEAWWICRNGHEWNTAVKWRNLGSGCPYCSGRRS